MVLADAPPPGEKGDSPAGFYPDPLGSANLRQWDGSRWTDRVRKMVESDGAPARSYRSWRIEIPRRAFRPKNPYRVLAEDGQLLFIARPGGRWYFPDLVVCEPAGMECLRLQRRGNWWSGDTGYRMPPEPVIDRTYEAVGDDPSERVYIRAGTI